MTDWVTSNLIAASAGTGKTYKLALRFLALLMLDVPPEQIVALTFTRKAAGEFRDRILQCLAEAAADAAGAARWAQAVRGTWVSPYGYSLCCPKESLPSEKEAALAALERAHPLTQEAFRAKLQQLADNLSRLQLSTLDGFFNTIVRLNSTELGLGRVQLLTDGAARDEERLNAFMQLFGSIAADEAATEGFLQLFSDFTDDGSQDLLGAMSKMVNVFHELYQSSENASVWGNLAAFEGLDYDPELPPVHEEEWDAVDEVVRELVRTKEKYVAPFATFVRKMREHRFEGMSRLEAAMDKLAPAGSALSRLQELAGPLMQRVRNDILRRTMYKTQGMHALLRMFSTVYDRNTRSAGKLEFSDITRHVPGLLEKHNAPTQLFYRLDARLQHWMLDEFQDTSPELMEAVNPLLSEVATAVAANPARMAPRSLFVVGDEKQSIYGFRGGTAELFRRFQERSPWKDALYCSSMAKSFRSSAVVMKFVNKVFREPAFDACYLPPEGFPVHETARDLQGCVAVSAVPGETAEEVSEAMCEAIARRLDELCTRCLDVGILVHRNAHGRKIADWLALNRPQHRTCLVGAAATLAEQSPTGALLLHFFRWLLHPGDAYRLHLLQASPLGVLLVPPADSACGAEETAVAPLQAVWQYWSHLAQERGYAALLLEMRAALAAAAPGLLLPEHEVYWAEWVAAATDYDAKGGTLEGWIHYAEELSQQGSAPKGTVQIMSIHKSKGLQFDAVILPLMGENNTYANERYLTHMVARDAQDRVLGILVPPAKYSRDAWPAFSSYAGRWRLQQIIEGRNLLYVALTRAKCANYILMPASARARTSDGAKKYSDSGVLLRALELDTAGDGENDGLLAPVIGNPDWAKDNNYPLRTAPVELQEAVRVQLPPPTAEPLRKVCPSRQEKEMPGDGAEDGEAAAAAVTPSYRSRARRERGDALAFGTAVHALFEQIVWWDEAAVPCWVKHPQNEAERTAARALRCPEIRALFDRAQFPGAQAYNEQSVESVSGGEWISASIDRLIIRPDGTALIVDYKTNLNAGHLADEYRGQMALYRRLVHEATGVATERIEVLLVAVGCPEPHLVPCRL